jgi:hypothetical protein
MNPCEGAGAAQAKTGDNAKALDRSRGMSSTLDAMGSKTRSGHPATKENNDWQGPSLGYGDDNIKT